ncbi:MAG TPA: hypothetical protein VGQ69_10935 [Gemmatimonadales bacterium]|jgi:hypothetical protein|nr:hypothetical protein [Gemmatimonadales bacterium]
MVRRAFWRAATLGSMLQAALVLLGLALSSLRQDNLYPIGSTLLALLTGVLFARWARGAQLLAVLWGAAVCGGISSLLGTLLVALSGQAPAPVSTALVAGVTGALAGSVGGCLGSLLRRSAPPA